MGSFVSNTSCALALLLSVCMLQLGQSEELSLDDLLSEDIQENSIGSGSLKNIVSGSVEKIGTGSVKNIGSLPTKTQTLIDGDAHDTSGKNVCDEKQTFFKLLLDETKERLEMKFKFENKISELYEDLQQLKSLYIKAQEELMSKRSVQNTVTFSAQVTSHLSGLQHDQTLVFSTILTNVGNCYNLKTGVFTTTTAGTYLFSATVLSNAGDRIETQIMTSDGTGAPSSVAKLYSGGSTNRYGSGSSMVILELNPKDRVWVQVYNGLGSFVYREWSSFSGILIHGK